MATRWEVYTAVSREREYQNKKWGTPLEHPHDVPGWLLIMRGELEEAEQAWLKSSNEAALSEVLQAVAVGVACLQQHGIFERDGDEQ